MAKMKVGCDIRPLMAFATARRTSKQDLGLAMKAWSTFHSQNHQNVKQNRERTGEAVHDDHNDLNNLN